ncbi:hypothetical protein EYF80_037745 [Liparis tanakae]|uniref:Uncharacterized protein n=1 Tax=Liparis tanakae TaxID=230148 RepID=A0A4Z2GFG5_9TELE|nr:hypothetical protein EYF80_037745 [Liparis tanakae]
MAALGWLHFSKVVSDSVVGLLQQSIVTVPGAAFEQLEHPEPVSQLDSQADGQIAQPLDELDALVVFATDEGLFGLLQIQFLEGRLSQKTPGCCGPMKDGTVGSGWQGAIYRFSIHEVYSFRRAGLVPLVAMLVL